MAESLKIKNVLITGGGGFVAPHLLNALEHCNLTVHVRNPAKATRFRPRDNLRIISSALSSSELLKQLGSDYDTVFHLAGAVTGDNVESVIDSNVVTTSDILNVMCRLKIPKLVFMSTAATWSDSAGATLNETTPISPTTLYGYAKLSAERLIADAVQEGKIASASILRCNNTYGPGGIQGVVATFMHRIAAGKAVQIQGDGNQLREPLFITDLIKVLIKAGEEQGGFRIYGISGPEALTVYQIAESISRALNSKLVIDWQPPNPERTRHLLIDTTLAKRSLNWAPTISFDEGCRLYANALLNSADR